MNLLRKSITILCFVCLAFEIYYISRFIFGYLHPSIISGFLLSHAQHYQYFLSWRISFFTHAFIGSVVLASGFVSILSIYKNIFSKKTHRLFGKIFISSVLFIAAPTGFFMSFFALGGFYGKLPFLILSLLWFVVTYQGYKMIRNQRILEHSALMIWSFGLACAALLQRRIAFILSIFLDQTVSNDQTIYIISAWSGWLICSIISLTIIFLKLKRSPLFILNLIFTNRNIK